jgi:hypothetical protein
MKRLLQLAATLLFTMTLVHAEPPAPQTGKQGKQPRRTHEDVEWLWQYTPADRDVDGRENELVQNDRFMPMLQDNFTAPQSFFGVQGTKFKPLPDTILDFLTVPDKVLQDDHRYVSISGCVIHFCPSRGLLWVDLNPAAKNSTGPDHLMIFAAIQWIENSKATTQPDAEYTLWVFPNQVLTVPGAGGPPSGPGQIPAAFKKAVVRWAAEPIAATKIVQKITHAVLVDPDGTQHPVTPAEFGVTGATPSDADSAAPLKPRTNN